ncbi:MAG: hypothetical protein PHE61_00700 [Candidatus Omnitrophica bacterium]|nr:hypothetical protein [Candidatus Omnitrophota bacterium]
METVGIPREIKSGEKRVGLTPAGVQYLVSHKVPVIVERDAGKENAFPNEAYEAAGARIAASREELWSSATLKKKVKEPLAEEFPLFKNGQVLFAFLHLASPAQESLTRKLLSSRLTAIAYETIMVGNYTPILKPMSIIAGVFAGYYAGIYKHLAEVRGGKIIYSNITKDVVSSVADKYPEIPLGFPPGNVVVLGGGQAGLKAAETCVRMGGKVVVTELNERRRRFLYDYFMDLGLGITILDAKKEYEDYLYEADVIIGCVYLIGKRAPVIIPNKLLGEISADKKKLIIDIAVDQGGNIEGSHPTTYDDPLYVDPFGNLRFGVVNMPSFAGRQASEALERATLDYTLALCGGVDQALRLCPELKSGVNVRNGEIVHPEILQIYRSIVS